MVLEKEYPSIDPCYLFNQDRYCTYFDRIFRQNDKINKYVSQSSINFWKINMLSCQYFLTLQSNNFYPIVINEDLESIKNLDILLDGGNYSNPQELIDFALGEIKKVLWTRF